MIMPRKNLPAHLFSIYSPMNRAIRAYSPRYIGIPCADLQSVTPIVADFYEKINYLNVL